MEVVFHGIASIRMVMSQVTKAIVLQLPNFQSCSQSYCCGCTLQNGQAYPCFCTSHRLSLLRREALIRGEVPRYDNRCRHLSHSEVQAKIDSGLPHVIRFKVYSSDIFVALFSFIS